MERFTQQRLPEGLKVSIKTDLFDKGLLETLRSRNDIGFLIMPETTEQEGTVELYYDLSGMTSLSEASSGQSDEIFFQTLERLIDHILSLPEYGLDAGRIMITADRVMLSCGEVKLICLCTQSDAREKQNASRVIIQQIGQLSADRKGMEELNNLLANPYCSLQAVQGRLKKMNESRHSPTDEPAVLSAGSNSPKEEAPVSDSIQAVSSEQPVFTPMNTKSGPEQRSPLFVPMFGESFHQTAPQDVSEPAVLKQVSAPSISQSIHVGINEETIVEETPDFRNVNQNGVNKANVTDFTPPLTYQTAGPDEMTVVDDPDASMGQQNTNPPSISEEKGKKTDKEKNTDQNGEPTQRKPKEEPDVYRPRTYEELKSFFWQNVIKLAGIAAGAAFLGIIAGAFLGNAALIVIILITAVLITFLFSRGYLSLSWPKKPAAGETPPAAPDVSDVFTVRLRLISQNLPTRQEVIIRQNDQIIGSDPNVCRVPVKQRGISRRHCKISCVRTSGHEEYYITDLGSKNGTNLNGERMEPNVAYPLKLGDHVTLAGVYDFRVGSDAY